MKEAVLQAKQELVTEISDKFKNSSSSVIVEYRGLSVAEVTELRRELREEGVDFTVYKNSMVVRAAEDAGYGDLKESLTGPNAFAFSEDAVAPARVLAKFAKTHSALVIKAGVVEGEVVGIDTITKLSKLPNRDGMISMFLSCLQAPIRDFACVVSAVRDQKQEQEQA
ncbi:LSU ribosomal protein L10P [Breznakia blatticola]|uniref:Large ribosomal subunit protein uL10 n=1 Tax=Breznakia blatticola TaxID=1754012 RepID=A0A4R7ZHN2_9FIRM|nr:50S ribosomal protein L10 [Breznakia blatticola]TDW16735.1 LSU ribosomal protein L10P [Breznakia blatticola]